MKTNYMTLVSGDVEDFVHQRIPTTLSPTTLWTRIQSEAKDTLAHEPTLGMLVATAILNRPSIEDAIVHRVSARLGNQTVSENLIADAFSKAIASDPSIASAFIADIVAFVTRDPACERYIEPFLYFKGYHAIQTHRLAHWLWTHDRRDLALYLQSRASDVLQTDIHPAARIGRGIFLDHATGFVVGTTSIIDDNVSILQDVTLGGSGVEPGERHPKIRSGVLIGAGAKILGDIEIGRCSRVAAGSLVLRSVPSNSTVAGVPARIVGVAGRTEPSRDMNHILSEPFDLSFDCSA